MLLKLDLSKAFDTLNWQYMRSLLLAFGFNSTWVSWILNLTSSALFSILINGVPSKPFFPTRGYMPRGPTLPLPLHHYGGRAQRYIKDTIAEGTP
jgi:hypothetical protein